MHKASVFLAMLAVWLPSCHSAALDYVAGGIGPMEYETIRVHLKLSKAEYLVAEPIFLDLKVENNGSAIACYDLRDIWKLQVRDEQGHPLKFRGRITSETHLVRDDTVFGPCGCCLSELKPGETSGISGGNLLDDYGEGEGALDYYLTAGTYRVTARDLKSDTLTFRVVLPKSPMDSAAAAELLGAIDNYYKLLRPATKMYSFYSTFVEKYPNSVYTTRALRWLLTFFPGEVTGFDEAKLQYYVRYFMTKFPESGFAFRALQKLNPDMVPVSDKNAVVNGLRRLKATLMAEDLRRRADELIEKLEK